MKKKWFALCTVCLLLLSLAGCGGSNSSSGGSSSAPSMTMDAASMDFNKNTEAGWDMPAEAPAPEPASGAENDYGGIDSSTGLPANAKIIYTANISLETKEFDEAIRAIENAVKDLGGYFESRNINQGGSYRSLNCVIRVPVEKFSALLDRAGEAAHVTDRSEYLEDVSEAYYDQEARLTTQRTKLERLQELLAQAENMEDIITIESAISETELQIEYLTGSLRKYDNLINYSTIDLYLREVYRLSTDEETPVTFGQRFVSAFSIGFQRGVDGLEDFAITVARNWVSLLIWIAIIAAVVLFLRRRKRKKAAQVPFSLPKMGKNRKENEPDSADAEKKE